jgi:hypothetical protein
MVIKLLENYKNVTDFAKEPKKNCKDLLVVTKNNKIAKISI